MGPERAYLCSVQIISRTRVLDHAVLQPLNMAFARLTVVLQREKVPAFLALHYGRF